MEGVLEYIGSIDVTNERVATPLEVATVQSTGSLLTGRMPLRLLGGTECKRQTVIVLSSHRSDSP